MSVILGLPNNSPKALNYNDKYALQRETLRSLISMTSAYMEDRCRNCLGMERSELY